MRMELFHGSNVVVDQPKIITDGYYKDFGYGFYCTNLEKQAKRWALVKQHGHVVNVYDYLENKSLNTLVFDEMTDEWLDFVVACRQGIKHDYDMVEGPMADDTIWNYVDDFTRGEISRTAFWELVKFKYPTHQIVFCSEKALKQLHFKRSYSL
ncbi:DUF3990 domain-containing protein [Coprobacillus sp. OF02-11LB]|nr:DUF3990 domain-containing protein [Coprobacillus sp. AM23-9LB]RGF87473.1 DUF3990 domain-containing protein [Coprobacillus sp. OF02-11LB]RGG95576.1 DUF3990 domain-containing protein [Coprobacillus sp. AF16-47]RGI04316.1 DUF3990 domain-containing protein [Coprobacillus sp. AM26-5AC]RHH12573.1 DUF3990 domain-containing protein [Coprobacillus sp. AM18-4LB-d2]RHR92392.1 DUF3990 domain-containing protein [Coprobacillus sp. AF15-30]